MIMNWSSSSPPKLKRRKPLAFLFLGLIFLMIIPASAASLAYAKTSHGGGSDLHGDGDKKKSKDNDKNKDEGKKKKKTKTNNEGGDNKKKKKEKEKTDEESNKKKDEEPKVDVEKKTTTTTTQKEKPKCKPSCHDTTNPPDDGTTTATSKTTINISTKDIIEGSQPIGSSANSNDTTGKLFREFNNRTNAATGLVVTDTTMTKNQFVKGQIGITGHVQNMRPANSSTTIGATRTASAATTNNNDINTARTVVIIATLYDNANNIIDTQYGASDPNTLTPGQGGVFHLIVNNAANNIDHVTYLVQWLGISGGNGVLHPTTYEVKAAAATTFPAVK
jgi:hypothetical protein